MTVPAHQIAAVVHLHSRRQMKTGDVDFAMLPAPFYIRVALPPRVGGWWCDVHKDAAVKEEVEWFSEVVDLSILGCLSFEEGGGGKRGGQLPLGGAAGVSGPAGLPG